MTVMYHCGDTLLNQWQKKYQMEAPLVECMRDFMETRKYRVEFPQCPPPYQIGARPPIRIFPSGRIG